MNVYTESPSPRRRHRLAYIISLCLLAWVIYGSLHNTTENNSSSHQTTAIMISSLLYYSSLMITVFALSPNTLNAMRLQLHVKEFFLLLAISYSLSLLRHVLPEQPLSSYETHTHYLHNLMDKHITLYLLIMILSVYSEELFFRVLPLSFSHKYPRFTMLIWQISFGIIHLPTQGFYAILHIVMGIVYWLSLEKGISLHTIALAHLAHNLIALL